MRVSPFILHAVCIGTRLIAADVGTGAAQAVHPTVNDGGIAGYTLAWSDEFTAATLDATAWDYRTDSKALSTQRKENVEVSDGMLLLHLRKEDAAGKQYTGGGVISRRAFRYGFYEARMRIPTGAGWHSSFWLMLANGKGGTDPAAACQELDVIENDSIHPDRYAVNVHRWKGTHRSVGGKAITMPALARDFHIYGCAFTPQTVTYFCDGKPVQIVDVTAITDKDGQREPFAHGDQHIWLTSIAYPAGGAEVDDSRLPAVATIDYVRYFAPPAPQP